MREDVGDDAEDGTRALGLALVCVGGLGVLILVLTALVVLWGA